MTNNRKQGHLCAFLTIFIWGTTFISTKILLADMTPLQILFTRFVIGYLTLWIMYPHRCTLEDKNRNDGLQVPGFAELPYIIC